MEHWDPAEFQAMLRTFLDRRGWSQNELALRSGISQAVINRWMQPINSTSPAGIVQPTDATLRKLAPVVGIPHQDLMRMAGRLQPDVDPSRKKRPSELASMINDVDAVWDELPKDRQDAIIDVVRSLAGAHRPRRPNRRGAQHRTGSPDSEESRRVLLTHN